MGHVIWLIVAYYIVTHPKLYAVFRTLVLTWAVLTLVILAKIGFLADIAFYL